MLERDPERERKEYRQLLREKKREFDQIRLTKLKQSVNDPKVSWQTIRLVNKKSVIYNDITKDQWYEHFFQVFIVQQSEAQTDEDCNDQNMKTEQYDPLFNRAISRDEVYASIGNLKAGKSAGPDKIVSEMLKNGGDAVVDYLFNYLFDSGTFPIEWSKSIIVPIHKKGDVNIPDNASVVAKWAKAGLTCLVLRPETNGA